MKIYALSFAGALLAATFLSPVYAADIQSTSKIDAITVFPRGAQVTRISKVDIPSGENTIILKDLPADVVPGSLRVEGDADGALSITSVDAKRVYIDHGADTSEVRKRIEAELEALHDKMRVLGDQVVAAQFRKKLVQRIPERYLRTPNPRKDDAATPEPDWPALLQLISSQMSGIDKEVQGLQVTRRDISRQIKALKKQLAQQAPAREQRTEVSVHLNADAPVSGVLKVHYQVAQAGWVQAYDARLRTSDDSAKTGLTLVHRADVTQATGEVWDNVTLKLSTTRPSGSTSAPAVHALKLEEIELRQEYSNTSAKYKRKLQRSLADDRAENPLEEQEALGGAAPEPRKAEAIDQQQAMFVPAGFQAVYQIRNRVSIGNTGQIKKVKIRDTVHAPELMVRAAPALDQTAYLYAQFTASDEAPMLSGPVALYRDGVFVGNGNLPHLAPTQEHKLGFGPDDAVQIKRVQLDHKAGETGILTTENRDKRSYKITVENHHKRALPVTILDRIPHSANEAIQVELMTGGTAPTRKDDDDRKGVMAWDLTLEPGGKSDIRFGYTVTWPTNMTINLARR